MRRVPSATSTSEEEQKERRRMVSLVNASGVKLEHKTSAARHDEKVVVAFGSGTKICDERANNLHKKAQEICDTKSVVNKYILEMSTRMSALPLLLLLLPCLMLIGGGGVAAHQLSPIIIQAPAISETHNNSNKSVPAHLQPASLLGAHNKSVNFTHLLVDEANGKIYVGATNWLFQLSARDLRLEQAIRTGPGGGGGGQLSASSLQTQLEQQAASQTSAAQQARDCSPADCLTQLSLVDTNSLLQSHLFHAHSLVSDLSATQWTRSSTSASHHQQARPSFSGATMHTTPSGSGNVSTPSSSVAQRARSQQVAPHNQLATTTSASSLLATTSSPTANNQQQVATTTSSHNNYNKILALDHESKQLIVCGSLNQGACRRHQLGNIANFSELIPLPVASNDEHSSTVALVAHQRHASAILYVAATNSRLGPYREMVPAISARSLDWSANARDRAMQIIERSFTDLARVDVSFEMRDYYLVNYVYAFQHNDFVYFATIQRKSPSRQLEELGYITRLARLCLNDMSFQSYIEMTLECATGATNYNLLQDAQLVQVGSSARSTSAGGGAMLVTAFAQSKDHTTRPVNKSAVCLFSMDKIEKRFQQNIDLCQNGTIKSRNMNYIAGSVNDCPRAHTQKQTQNQNYCNEPIKLNGSLALTSEPIITYDNELVTALSSTLAPTSPLNIQHTSFKQSSQFSTASSRQHQVLLVGTASGQLKRLVLVADSADSRVKALEFDSIQVHEPAGGGGESALLADMQLTPASNPQLQALSQDQSLATTSSHKLHQFALVATPHKLIKLRVNACKAPQRKSGAHRHALNSSALVDECLACAQLQDPFCGWCSTLGACTARDECLLTARNQQQQQQQHLGTTPVHWTPFDSIRCSNYQPISPKNLPIQVESFNHANHQLNLVDVNIRLLHTQQQQQQQRRPVASSQDGEEVDEGNAAGGVVNSNQWLASKLAHAQFSCHFDYLSYWNKSAAAAATGASAPRLSGATTKSAQARLNLHAGTVAIGCPLPVQTQRPALAVGQESARVRLSVRLQSIGGQSPAVDNADRALLEQALGMRPARVAPSADTSLASEQHARPAAPIERELTLYDCTQHFDCTACLSAGSLGRRWTCAWCPLSARCTFNASHPDFGCAASAVASTTTPHYANNWPIPNNSLLNSIPPHYQQQSDEQQQQSTLVGFSSNQIRGSHLTPSLDRAQASALGVAIERLDQCPASADSTQTAAGSNQSDAPTTPSSGGEQSLVGVPTQATHKAIMQPSAASSDQVAPQIELLVPNAARRALQVQLSRPIQFHQRDKRVIKLECLVDLEGAKARFSARLLDQSSVLCQENVYSYQSDVATHKATLNVILNDNQVIETVEVIIYKCHLFGVNPPALTSSSLAAPVSVRGTLGVATTHHSSASWPTFDLFLANHQHDDTGSAHSIVGSAARRSSDCSLCANIERKYSCAWCANQCKHSDSCQQHELAASTCPPPRIDSIHPTSGPLEGGTLLTIEGSNLGSNEREIQDRIHVGRELCALVVYSVSTRIVCKTAPSLMGPQAATIFVGNRVGVTSALDKFHYKPVHLTDVNPRVGPASGGTRLFLSGANLNIGSRVQIFLDDIPCLLDSQYEHTSHQITCVTSPNLIANSMRVARLTLMIDNSTHSLPYPFTYQPDPIVTSIEPAESFVSGGRLILIAGQHLSWPQTTKLILYDEQKPEITNATSCMKQNDTLITCLTPAFSRELLLQGRELISQDDDDNESQEISSSSSSHSNLLSYDSSGVKLKMMLVMDDVKSVRNLDEYYHHLPHHIAYFDDPHLFKLAPAHVIEYKSELEIAGENLRMRQLDQDILITIGQHVCQIKSIERARIICEPPARINPIYESSTPTTFDGNQSAMRRKLVERPLLPIVALIGSNLRFDIGFMQYSASQYAQPSSVNGQQQQQQGDNSYFASIAQQHLSNVNTPFSLASDSTPPMQSTQTTTTTQLSAGLAALMLLSMLGFTGACALVSTFALARLRQARAKQREYKRIQLQMGSLDANGQPGGVRGPFSASGLFDKIHLPSSYGGVRTQTHQPPQFGYNNNSTAAATTTATTTKPMFCSSSSKPFYQFFTSVGTSSFPSSPLTDISSLVGSSPQAHAKATNQAQQQVVKLMSSSSSNNNTGVQQYLYATGGVNLSAGSSSPTTLLPRNACDSFQGHTTSGGGGGGENKINRRNFNWTQEAPSTIVPYAVIEASDLTLEGKKALKEFV